MLEMRRDEAHGQVKLKLTSENVSLEVLIPREGLPAICAEWHCECGGGRGSDRWRGRIVSTLRLLKLSSDVEDKVTNVVVMRRCEGYEIK
jgi:hypothetical protein